MAPPWRTCELCGCFHLARPVQRQILRPSPHTEARQELPGWTSDAHTASVAEPIRSAMLSSQMRSYLSGHCRRARLLRGRPCTETREMSLRKDEEYLHMKGSRRIHGYYRKVKARVLCQDPSTIPARGIDFLQWEFTQVHPKDRGTSMRAACRRHFHNSVPDFRRREPCAKRWGCE